ncbi:hypothetical protein MTBBW1_1230007 [Desulfamplus magnetovallimortis]|uniref:Uncharacterized protein n=1 Tax=Desulfamplus magnetovallimortis TaxID=1246637 RepID=A0A1W1H6H1_9BACT|nr:hypothetical protein [Desulfamplus magnetovallimortis]SLM28036.1 hypothetical protein MTBBW1_1230007 [Desulfamplus magnetovallimortis]
MDTQAFQIERKENFISRLHRLPQHLRIRVVQSIHQEILAAENEAGLATTREGLPFVFAEERIQILNSLPTLDEWEDSDKWIERIQTARLDKTNIPHFE